MFCTMSMVVPVTVTRLTMDCPSQSSLSIDFVKLCRIVQLVRPPGQEIVDVPDDNQNIKSLVVIILIIVE